MSNTTDTNKSTSPTPGPWHHRPTNHGPDTGALGYTIENAACVWEPDTPNEDGTLGAWKPTDVDYWDYQRIARTTDGPNAEANARLIAAAPAMRDALRNLLNAVDEYGMTDHAGEKIHASYGDRPTMPEVEAARAALRRVEADQ